MILYHRLQDKLRLLDKYCKGQSAAMIAYADEIATGTFRFYKHWDMERCLDKVTFPLNRIDWEYVYHGDVEWLYQLNRLGYFIELAKAYVLTKQDKYRQAYLTIVNHWIDNCPLTAQSKNTTWRSLEVGLRAGALIRSMALFSDSIPNDVVKKIQNCLREHGEYLKEEYHEFHAISNWGILQDEGLFFIGAYLNDKAYMDLALSRLYKNTQHSMLADGVHWEQSPMYHGEVLNCLLSVVQVASCIQVSLNKGFLQNIKKMAHALGAMTKSNGDLFCQSDSDKVDARNALVYSGMLFQDKALLAYGNKKVYEELVWDFHEDQIERYLNTTNKPVIRSSALLDSGNFYLRDAQNQVTVHFHAGVLGSGHGHADLLHINLEKGGQDILVDSGRYTYVDTPIRRRLKMASAHNTTMVDNTEFSMPKDSWGYQTIAEPLKSYHKFTKKIDYVEGGHLGYLEQNIPVFPRRKVMLIKPNIMIVYDAFYGVGEHNYKSFWHFAHNLSVEKSEKCIDFFNDQICGKMFAHDCEQIELNRTQVSEHYNKLEDSFVAVQSTNANGFFLATTVFVFDDNQNSLQCSVQKEDVFQLRSKKKLPPSKASGLSVQVGTDRYTIISCFGESISEVDMLKCTDKFGYGKMLVFKNDEKPEIVLY